MEAAEGQAGAAEADAGAIADHGVDPIVFAAAVAGEEEAPFGRRKVVRPLPLVVLNPIRHRAKDQPPETPRSDRRFRAPGREAARRPIHDPQTLQRVKYRLHRFSPLPLRQEDVPPSSSLAFGQIPPARLLGAGVDGGNGVPVMNYAMLAALPLVLRLVVERMVCRLSCS